jgi:microcystin-dependent protein
VPVGVGQGPGLSAYQRGDHGGAADVTLTPAQMPPHTHQLIASNTPALNAVPDGTQRLAVANVRTYGAAQNLVAMQQTSSAGGLPHNNRQPFLALNFIIALQGVYPERPTA